MFQPNHSVSNKKKVAFSGSSCVLSLYQIYNVFSLFIVFLFVEEINAQWIKKIEQLIFNQQVYIHLSLNQHFTNHKFLFHSEYFNRTTSMQKWLLQWTRYLLTHFDWCSDLFQWNLQQCVQIQNGVTFNLFVNKTPIFQLHIE